MAHKKTVMTAALLAALTTGCMTTTVKDLQAFSPVEMSDADVMPSKKQLAQERIRVIVLKVEDSIPIARQFNLGQTMTAGLESVVGDGGAEVVDRSLAEKLEKEVQLIESTGKAEYSGPEVANYVIKAQISAASGDGSWMPKTKTPKIGPIPSMDIPAHTSVVGKITGNLKIYELPNMRQVATVDLKGTSSTKLGVGQNGIVPRYEIDQALKGLMAPSAEDAIKSARTEIQNVFAQKGYVTEKRVKGKEVIFKVLLGKKLGVKPNDKLNFINLRESVDSMTQSKHMEELVVGEGTVSDQITEEYSWVVASDEKTANSIKRGQFAKVKFEKSLLEKVNSGINAIR